MRQNTGEVIQFPRKPPPARFWNLRGAACILARMLCVPPILLAYSLLWPKYYMLAFFVAGALLLIAAGAGAAWYSHVLSTNMERDRWRFVGEVEGLYSALAANGFFIIAISTYGALIPYVAGSGSAGWLLVCMFLTVALCGLGVIAAALSWQAQEFLYEKVPDHVVFLGEFAFATSLLGSHLLTAHNMLAATIWFLTTLTTHVLIKVWIWRRECG